MTRSLVITLLALALLPAGAYASGGSGDGRIAWSRYTSDFGASQIVTARPDGSHLRVLTNPSEGTWDVDPKWSPDGRRIVFQREFADGGAQIVLMGADGRGERVLELGCEDPCVLDLGPSWTPDGRRIAFTRVIGPFDGPNEGARSAVMWTARLDGTGIRRLSAPGGDGIYDEGGAHWSPDGSYIQFIRVRNETLNNALFRMRPDGSDVRQLTPWEIDADMADLSPATRGRTKDLVVFETFFRDGRAENIGTVPATCTTLADCTKRIRYLTSNMPDGPTNSISPAWSPDGSRIAFAEWTVPGNADIYTMDPDGRNRRLVSRGPEFSYRPNWGITAEGWLFR